MDSQITASAAAGTPTAATNAPSASADASSSAASTQPTSGAAPASASNGSSISSAGLDVNFAGESVPLRAADGTSAMPSLAAVSRSTFASFAPSRGPEGWQSTTATTSIPSATASTSASAASAPTAATGNMTLPSSSGIKRTPPPKLNGSAHHYHAATADADVTVSIDQLSAAAAASRNSASPNALSARTPTAATTRLASPVGQLPPLAVLPSSGRVRGAGAPLSSTNSSGSFHGPALSANATVSVPATTASSTASSAGISRPTSHVGRILDHAGISSEYRSFYESLATTTPELAQPPELLSTKIHGTATGGSARAPAPPLEFAPTIDEQLSKLPTKSAAAASPKPPQTSLGSNGQWAQSASVFRRQWPGDQKQTRAEPELLTADPISDDDATRDDDDDDDVEIGKSSGYRRLTGSAIGAHSSSATTPSSRTPLQPTATAARNGYGTTNSVGTSTPNGLNGGVYAKRGSSSAELSSAVAPSIYGAANRNSYSSSADVMPAFQSLSPREISDMKYVSPNMINVDLWQNSTYPDFTLKALALCISVLKDDDSPPVNPNQHLFQIKPEHEVSLVLRSPLSYDVIGHRPANADSKYTHVWTLSRCESTAGLSAAVNAFACKPGESDIDEQRMRQLADHESRWNNPEAMNLLGWCHLFAASSANPGCGENRITENQYRLALIAFGEAAKRKHRTAINNALVVMWHRAHNAAIEARVKEKAAIANHHAPASAISQSNDALPFDERDYFLQLWLRLASSKKQGFHAPAAYNAAICHLMALEHSDEPADSRESASGARAAVSTYPTEYKVDAFRPRLALLAHSMRRNYKLRTATAEGTPDFKQPVASASGSGSGSAASRKKGAAKRNAESKRAAVAAVADKFATGDFLLRATDCIFDNVVMMLHACALFDYAPAHLTLATLYRTAQGHGHEREMFQSLEPLPTRGPLAVRLTCNKWCWDHLLRAVRLQYAPAEVMFGSIGIELYQAKKALEAGVFDADAAAPPPNTHRVYAMQFLSEYGDIQHYLLRAARQGSTEALYQLARVLLRMHESSNVLTELKGLPAPTPVGNATPTASDDMDRHTAYRCVSVIAPFHRHALSLLVLCHYYGWGTQMDREKAFACFELSMVDRADRAAGCAPEVHDRMFKNKKFEAVSKDAREAVKESLTPSVTSKLGRQLQSTPLWRAAQIAWEAAQVLDRRSTKEIDKQILTRLTEIKTKPGSRSAAASAPPSATDSFEFMSPLAAYGLQNPTVPTPVAIERDRDPDEKHSATVADADADPDRPPASAPIPIPGADPLSRPSTIAALLRSHACHNFNLACKVLADMRQFPLWRPPNVGSHGQTYCSNAANNVSPDWLEGVHTFVGRLPLKRIAEVQPHITVRHSVGSDKFPERVRLPWLSHQWKAGEPLACFTSSPYEFMQFIGPAPVVAVTDEKSSKRGTDSKSSAAASSASGAADAANGKAKKKKGKKKPSALTAASVTDATELPVAILAAAAPALKNSTASNVQDWSSPELTQQLQSALEARSKPSVSATAGDAVSVLASAAERQDNTFRSTGLGSTPAAAASAGAMDNTSLMERRAAATAAAAAATPDEASAKSPAEAAAAAKQAKKAAKKAAARAKKLAAAAAKKKSAGSDDEKDPIDLELGSGGADEDGDDDAVGDDDRKEIDRASASDVEREQSEPLLLTSAFAHSSSNGKGSDLKSEADANGTPAALSGLAAGSSIRMNKYGSNLNGSDAYDDEDEDENADPDGSSKPSAPASVTISKLRTRLELSREKHRIELDEVRRKHHVEWEVREQKLKNDSDAWTKQAVATTERLNAEHQKEIRSWTAKVSAAEAKLAAAVASAEPAIAAKARKAADEEWGNRLRHQRETFNSQLKERTDELEAKQKLNREQIAFAKELEAKVAALTKQLSAAKSTTANARDANAAVAKEKDKELETARATIISLQSEQSKLRQEMAKQIAASSQTAAGNTEKLRAEIDESNRFVAQLKEQYTTARAKLAAVEEERNKLVHELKEKSAAAAAAAVVTATSEALNAAGSVSRAAVGEWSIDKVVGWLRAVGLGEHAQAFTNEEISGAALLDLDKSELKELGVTKLGHIKLIQKLTGSTQQQTAQPQALLSPSPTPLASANGMPVTSPSPVPVTLTTAPVDPSQPQAQQVPHPQQQMYAPQQQVMGQQQQMQAPPQYYYEQQQQQQLYYQQQQQYYYQQQLYQQQMAAAAAAHRASGGNPNAAPQPQPYYVQHTPGGPVAVAYAQPQQAGYTVVPLPYAVVPSAASGTAASATAAPSAPADASGSASGGDAAGDAATPNAEPAASPVATSAAKPETAAAAAAPTPAPAAPVATVPSVEAAAVVSPTASTVEFSPSVAALFKQPPAAAAAPASTTPAVASAKPANKYRDGPPHTGPPGSSGVACPFVNSRSGCRYGASCFNRHDMAPAAKK